MSSAAPEAALSALLARHGFDEAEAAQMADALRQEPIGVKKPADMAVLEDDDLKMLKLTAVEFRKLKKAIEAVHEFQDAGGGGSAAPSRAAHGRAVKDVKRTASEVSAAASSPQRRSTGAGGAEARASAEAPIAAVTESSPTRAELESRTWRQLKELCANEKIRLGSKYLKADLLQVLEEHYAARAKRTTSPSTPPPKRAKGEALQSPGGALRAESSTPPPPPSRLSCASSPVTPARSPATPSVRRSSTPRKEAPSPSSFAVTSAGKAPGAPGAIPTVAATVEELTEHRRRLGVGPNATEQELGSAWRKHALALHPDKCRGNDPEEFLRVKRAYDALMEHLQTGGIASQVQKVPGAVIAVRARVFFEHLLASGGGEWIRLVRALDSQVLEVLYDLFKPKQRDKEEGSAASFAAEAARKKGEAKLIRVKGGWLVEAQWRSFRMKTSTMTWAEAVDWYRALTELKKRAACRMSSDAEPLTFDLLWKVLEEQAHPLAPVSLIYWSDMTQNRLRLHTPQCGDLLKVVQFRKELRECTTDTEFEKLHGKHKAESVKCRRDRELLAEKVLEVVVHEARERGLPFVAAKSQALAAPPRLLALSEAPPMSERDVRTQRASSDGLAEKSLESFLGEDSTVLQVLQRWCFDRNTTREQLLLPGETFCSSDTFGTSWLSGVHVNRKTWEFPSVCKLLATYVRSKWPDFPFTTIVVNRNFRCKRHRDRGNFGPTILIPLGSFTGGGLKMACGNGPDMTIELDVKKGQAILFDANLEHEVTKFKGERFTIMAYTVPSFEKLTDADKHWLRTQNFHLPEGPDTLHLLKEQVLNK